jgi:2-polyprenyl-3-methyl-5-hydroxy-6-metoxy-1,4-benzoquinol methylase
MSSSLEAVLRNWGEPEPLPLNGKAGIELIEMLVSIIRAQPGITTVCDLGCGPGYLASRLGATGLQVLGVDASDVLLATANQHHATDRVSFARCVIGETSADVFAPGRKFDLVVSSDVIEHLPLPTTLMRTASDLLRPGGIFICCTPYHGYLKNLALAILGKWDAHHHVHFDGGHVKFFSVATLTAMLVREGFAVDRFYHHGRVPGLWKNMIAVARKAG